jgi:cobalt/nickel transport system permease protein
MVSVLFVRSMKKAAALYDSMEARCYDGTLRVLNENCPPRLPEIAAIAVFELFLLVLVIWGILP